jgi:enoyl-CoA hydratase/carnithine racemase
MRDVSLSCSYPTIDLINLHARTHICPCRTLRKILTGRPVSAAEALQAGLANRVVPSGQAKQAAIELVRDPSFSELPQLYCSTAVVMLRACVLATGAVPGGLPGAVSALRSDVGLRAVGSEP